MIDIRIIEHSSKCQIENQWFRLSWYPVTCVVPKIDGKSLIWKLIEFVIGDGMHPSIVQWFTQVYRHIKLQMITAHILHITVYIRNYSVWHSFAYNSFECHFISLEEYGKNVFTESKIKIKSHSISYSETLQQIRLDCWMI